MTLTIDKIYFVFELIEQNKACYSTTNWVWNEDNVNMNWNKKI